MKRELNFGVVLFLCCSCIFYSCNNGGDARTESTMDSTSTNLTTHLDSSKTNGANLDTAKKKMNVTLDGYTHEDSLMYQQYYCEVYPAILTGQQLNDIYEDMQAHQMHIGFKYSFKNPFNILAAIITSSTTPDTFHLESLKYPLPMIPLLGVPIIKSDYWRRPSIVLESSIRNFIKELKKDSGNINFEKDYSKYQFLITPKVMKITDGGKDNQYISMDFSLEQVGTQHDTKEQTEAQILLTQTKLVPNPCPTCRW